MGIVAILKKKTLKANNIIIDYKKRLHTKITISINFTTENFDALKTLRINRSRP